MAGCLVACRRSGVGNAIVFHVFFFPMNHWHGPCIPKIFPNRISAIFQQRTSKIYPPGPLETNISPTKGTFESMIWTFFQGGICDRSHRGYQFFFLDGGFKNFWFSSLFGEDEPILTNIFQLGWNYHLDIFNHSSLRCSDQPWFCRIGVEVAVCGVWLPPSGEGGIWDDLGIVGIAQSS